MLNIRTTKCSVTCFFIICILVFLCVVSYNFHNSVKEMYVDDDNEIFKEIKNRIKQVSPVLAKIPIKSSNKTYILDKSVIYLCVKDDYTHTHDIDTVMIAYVHELAHSISESIGHEEEFQKNNLLLLNCCHNKGLLNKYHKMPRMYCGVENTN